MLYYHIAPIPGHIQGLLGVHGGFLGEGHKGGRGVSLSMGNAVRHFLRKNTTMQESL